jgi:hypothetical protein
VGYQSCDDSTALTQGYEVFKCATNARDFSTATKLVAIIGPYDSGCAQAEIPGSQETASGRFQTLQIAGPAAIGMYFSFWA